MCFSRLKNIQSLTSKNTGTIIVILSSVFTPCIRQAAHGIAILQRYADAAIVCVKQLSGYHLLAQNSMIQ
jgi:hypothetical protein